MNTMNTMTDHELVTLYEQGKDSAFDVLLSRYQDYLYSYILYLVRNREDADDIFQDTFARAIVAVRNHRYQCTGKFGAWLIRIAHNLAIDATRSPMSAMTSPRDLDAPGMLNSMRYSVEAHDVHFIARQREEILHQMVARLPQSQQEVVRMRFFEDLTFREIAEQKGISINTALGRMRYALINLRRIAHQFPIDSVG